MPTQEIQAAIKALEVQLKYYESILNQSIRNDEILAKTKVIYKDLKAVSDKLTELKKLQKQ